MRFSLFFLFLCAASVALAEERFYQVIDASGRMQLIREGIDEKAVEKSAEEKSDSPRSRATDVSPSVSAEKFDETAPAPALVKASPSSPYAVYESDEYIDSEVMDESHRSNDKKRFVILSDGVGQRIENMSGTNEAFSAPLSTAISENYVALKNTYVPLPIVSAKDIRGGCLSEPQMNAAQLLPVGRISDIVFDKRLANYIAAGELVQTYRIRGHGARTVFLRSYAKTDLEPSFIVPLLAFADAKGCIDRVADSYFQRFYPETKSRHPLLEASLVMHSEDTYLLFIMPGGLINTVTDSPEYRISSVGRVSIKWQP